MTASKADKSTRGWIGVDLDGTLAEYDEWRGVEHVGAPIPAMLERVKRWLTEGRNVRIFTARVSRLGSLDFDEHTDGTRAKRAIEIWCLVHLGVALPVTCVKDFDLIALVDDRAVAVEKNTGRLLSVDEDGCYTRADGECVSPLPCIHTAREREERLKELRLKLQCTCGSMHCRECCE